MESFSIISESMAIYMYIWAVQDPMGFWKFSMKANYLVALPTEEGSERWWFSLKESSLKVNDISREKNKQYAEILTAISEDVLNFDVY
jgi:hypothetical protein